MKHLALAALGLAACVDAPPPEGEQVTSVVERREIPMSFNTQLDLLFVIDNSSAMTDAQQKLLGDYRSMIDVLSKAAAGVLPDVHLGVVTTDRADQGRLRKATFLADAPRFAWRREANYDGPLADRFVDLASVGTSGSASTQPLEVMQRAVSATVNPGFVREQAYLAVVFVTASDDHGTATVADVARAMKQLKTDPSKLIVSAALPCDGVAPRLLGFLDQFPNRSARASLCDADLRGLVALTGNLLKASLGLACFDRVRTPHDCTATLVDPGSDEQALLPECSGPASDRCWSITPDDSACGAGGQGLHFRPWAFPFPATAIVECVAE